TKTVGQTENGDSLNRPLVRYQLGNHLGSASLELDGKGALISYEEYHPYGTTAFQLHSSEVSRKRYRYTGMERDEETGLNYHGARYYALWLGRWCSCDPIGIGDGVNVYGYVGGNPLGLSDLQGTQRKDPSTEELYRKGVMYSRQLNDLRAQRARLVEEYNYVKKLPSSSDKNAKIQRLQGKMESIQLDILFFKGEQREVALILGESFGKDDLQHYSKAKGDYRGAAHHIANLLQAAWNMGTYDRAKIAYIIATADHESKMGQSMHQKGETGYNMGRGYGHLTTKGNYKYYGEKFGVDLLKDKEKAADEMLSAYILVYMYTEDPAMKPKSKKGLSWKEIIEKMKEGISAADLAAIWLQSRKLHNKDSDKKISTRIGKLRMSNTPKKRVLTAVAKRVYARLGGKYKK
ncbi:MAG: RHS repeat-associated core domain-containing protein, partial [Candidatus Electrothrix sp. AR4]|nr:RHS repeat-associated core domain-containing protein [Candidatus Electrothrix sp. AR4]